MDFGAKHRIIFLNFIFLFFFFIKGQDTLNSLIVENQSYQLYSEKKWQDLEKFGGGAIEKGFDYYYLRMRIGTAYFERGDYVNAQKHFEQALKFNSGDDVAMEYLYFCFVYSGRYEEARWISKSFSLPLRRKLITDSTSTIAFSILESGIKTADSSNIFNNGFYLHAGRAHYVSNRFSLFHAVTFFSQGQFDGQGKQLQYYLRANIPAKNNWLISPAFHLIGKSFSPLGKQPPPQQMGNPHNLPPKQPPAILSAYFAACLAVKKTFPHFNFSAGATIANIFNATLLQQNVSATYSPFRKNILFIGCTGYIHTENSYKKKYYATYPYLVLNPSKNISLSVSYLNNSKGSNIVEADGYIINNSSDLTTSRWSYSASVALSKKTDLYGLYQFENKLESHKNFIYHYNLFVIGLKIKPN